MALPKTPYRADHVGSLLRPPELKDAREKANRGEFAADKLKEIEDRHIRDAVKLQESAGLHSITDGEFRRTSFHFDFLGRLDGVAARISALESAPAAKPGEKPAAFSPPQLKVEGKVRHTRNIEVDGFKFLKAATRRTPKLTIPSPTMMLRGGRGAVSTQAYPDLAEYHQDVVKAYAAELKALADAGCTYIQFDDTNYAYLCDSTMRDAMRGRGEDPDALPRVYTKLINDVIAAAPKSISFSIHLCRGNLHGRWAAEGGYEPIAEVLFAGLNVDGYFLEYESARAGGFEPLRFMPKTKKVVIGLLSSKVGDMETKSEVKRRLDEASKFVAMDNICLGPQCGFASSYKGNPVTEDTERRKLRLIVEIATEVWGTAQ